MYESIGAISSMKKENNYAGGLSNYIVLKEEKEVIFYLHNPYPDCLTIPEIMKQRFPDDYKSIITSNLDEFNKYGEGVGRKHEQNYPR